MEHKYLTAILPTTLSDAWGINPINWIDPRLQGTPGYYPNILLSYYHWRTDRRTFDPDVFVFGDSGGYSIATLGAVLDPEHVMNWQIRNCDIGVLLDVPPFISTDGASVLGGSASSNWKQALDRSVKHTQRALPLYLQARKAGTSFRWWGVVHGETWEQLEEWHSRISAVYPFEDEGEGWAFKVHPANDPVQLARLLHFVKQVGVRRAHFLQMTGIPALTVLFWLGPQAGLEFVTYDSASSSFGGFNRTVYVPTEDGLDWRPLGEKFREKGETHARDYMMDSCECISCELAREAREANPGAIDEEYYKYRMIFHNTLVSARTFERLKERVDSIAEEPATSPGLLGEIKHGSGLEPFIRKRVPRYDDVLRAWRGELPKETPVGTPMSLLQWTQD